MYFQIRNSGSLHFNLLLTLQSPCQIGQILPSTDDFPTLDDAWMHWSCRWWRVSICEGPWSS